MDTTNLKKKHRTWYAQLRVPSHLIGIIGKQVLSRSLKTHDEAEAVRRKHAVLADFHRIIDAAQLLAGTQGNASSHPVDQLTASAKLLLQQVRTGELPQDEAVETWEHLVDSLDVLPEETITADQASTIRTLGQALKHPNKYALLSDAIKSFLEEDKERLRPSTIRERRKSLEEFMAWRGDCELDAVQKAEAGQYVAEVLIPKKLAASTIKHTLGDLSGFWNWACGRGTSTNNPFDGIARTVRAPARGVRKDENKDLRPWTPEEMEKLITKTDLKSDLWVMSVLALYTGCRVNELAEMECVDVNGSYLRIPEAKSPAGRRVVPLHPIIKPLVAHLKETSTDGYLVSGLRRGGYDKKRHHMFAKRFSYHKTKHLELPPATVFHGLRKNFVTSLHNAGVALDRIQQVVGHETGSLALDVYSDGVELTKMAKEVRKVTHGKRVDKLVTEHIVKLTNGKAEG